jgi:hypothetical protein
VIGTLDGLPFLHTMPRVSDDLQACSDFIASQPWGRPEARRQDIARAVDAILRWPTLGPVGLYRPSIGRELRQRRAAQFLIIYAYFPPDRRFPTGCVSFRAIRHRRVRNVFHGVKEPESPRYGRDDSIPKTNTPSLSGTACIQSSQSSGRVGRGKGLA